MGKINWLGVTAATIAAFFIGFLWYGLLFEKQWMALSGVPADGDHNPIWMVVGLVQTFVTMTGLGWFIARDGDGGGWMGGMKIGLVASICFALMTSAYGFVYHTSDIGLLPIDWSHLLLIYAVGGAIIGGWRLKAKA